MPFGGTRRGLLAARSISAAFAASDSPPKGMQHESAIVYIIV